MTPHQRKRQTDCPAHLNGRSTRDPFEPACVCYAIEHQAIAFLVGSAAGEGETP
jgi:hypothetical protein